MMDVPPRPVFRDKLISILVILVFLLPVLFGPFFRSSARSDVAQQGDVEDGHAAGGAGIQAFTIYDGTDAANGSPERLHNAIPIIPDYALTIGKTGSGTGVVTGPEIECGTTCLALFPQGTEIELTAAPGPGATFAGWSGGGCGGMNSCLMTITAATEVTAIFKKLHTITIVAGNFGKVASIDPVSAALASDGVATVSMLFVEPGVSRTFRMVPNPGCRISRIQVDGKTVVNSNTFTFSNITSDHTIRADFASGTNSVTDSGDGKDGRSGQ